MKFDAARATGIFEKLGDPLFAGRNGEAQVADFVAEQFDRMGWMVQRHEVQGPRFLERAAPLVGWLGYGALVTAAYLILFGKNARIGFVAVFLLLPAQLWLSALLRNRIRWGRLLLPVEAASLIIARPAGDSSSPVRVVFHAVLGGLKTDSLASNRLNRSRILIILHSGFFLTTGFTVATRLGNRPVAPVIWLAFASGFIAMIWCAILWILSQEVRQSRLLAGSHQAERHGLSLLLELARSWPRSRPIEAVFVAAGGQRLDYAGSREVVRLLGSEWPAKPSLLLLFFAPGAGGEHRLAPIVSASGGAEELAREAARSLWIPMRGNDPWSHFAFWPFERNFRAADVIALIGSHSRSSLDASVNPHVLEHAAQLAMEIALRWAKNQQQTRRF
jgi:hypothetical protein